MYDEDDEIRVVVTAEGRLQLDRDTDVKRVKPFLYDMHVLEVDRLFEDDEPDGQLEYKIEFSTLECVSGDFWDWAIERRPSAIDSDLEVALEAFSYDLKKRCHEAGFYAYLEVDKVLDWEGY